MNSEERTETDAANRKSLGEKDLKRAFDLLLEENLQLKQIVNDVIITNQRWQRYNQERASQLKLILHSVEMLRKERNSLRQEVEKLKNHVIAFKNDLELEKRAHSKTKSDCNIAKTLIVKLNEETWQLRNADNYGVVLAREAHPDPNHIKESQD